MIHTRCLKWQTYFLLTIGLSPDGFKIFCFEENDTSRDDLSSNQHYSLYIVSTVSSARQYFLTVLLDVSIVDSLNCYIKLFLFRATTCATYQDVNIKINSNVKMVIDVFNGRFCLKKYLGKTLQ